MAEAGIKDQDAVLDAYYGTVLPIAVQVSTDFEVLHASAVLHQRHGVIAFCAMSETGKSTVAYGMHERGYPLWADDAVAFGVEQHGEIIGSQMPHRLKLRSGSEGYFGIRSRPRFTLPGNDGTFEQRRPFAAICAIERVSQRETCVPLEVLHLSPGKALRTLLPHAYFFQPLPIERKSLLIRTYLELISRIPILRVRFQTGFDHLPRVLDAVEEAIAEVGGQSAPLPNMSGAGAGAA